MSLDVYLIGDEPDSTETVTCCDCGHQHECPRRAPYLYEANITHNLNRMAEAAGIYYELWRPEEINITKARELIGPLDKGLALLEQFPDRFKAFNAPNGWGMYEHFVPFVRHYLAACREYPDATISVSR